MVMMVLPVAFILVAYLMETSAAFRYSPLFANSRRVDTGPIVASRSLSTRLQANQPLDKGFNLLEIASGGLIPQGVLVQTVAESWKFAWGRMMAELAPQDSSGNYQRLSYSFKHYIGESSTFPDEAGGRYHLYVGNPCPWCHRAVLTVKTLGLTADQVGVTQLEDNPFQASRGGWILSATDPDPVFQARDLRQIYDKLSPGYQGRCTAPLLIDKKSRRIVSNESSDIIRMLNKATWGRSPISTGSSTVTDNDPGSSSRQIDLYPLELAHDIDVTNEWVYRLLNNGVYRCGFATTQSAYNLAGQDVREGMQRANDLLSGQTFLCGSDLTEADVRLLPTMLRFDGAYAPLFKAGGTHLRTRDYPHLHRWMRHCWLQVPGVAESIDIGEACASYYRQLFPLNPGRIIPLPATPASLGLA